VNDTNNDYISRFTITSFSLHFHSTRNTLRYLTAGPEVGLLQAVQKVRCAAQSSDKKIGESYHPPSALSHRVTIKCMNGVQLFGKPNFFTTL
jgi:hypothetical protein